MENLNTERHLNSIWLSPVLTVRIIWIPSHPHSKSMKRWCLIWLNICLDSYYNRTLQINSKWTIFFTSYLQEHILSPSNHLPNSRSAAEEVCVNQQSSPTSLHIMYIYMHINALCIIYLHFCTNYVQIKPNFKWRHNYTCVWMLFAFCRFMLWMLWRPSVWAHCNVVHNVRWALPAAVCLLDVKCCPKRITYLHLVEVTDGTAIWIANSNKYSDWLL